MPKNTPKKPGRPEGAKNATEIVHIEPSRCKKCGSSRRSAYRGSRTQRFGSGTAMTAIIFRHCTCLNCGQSRVDREPVYERSEQISEENNANGNITSAATAAEH